MGKKKNKQFIIFILIGHDRESNWGPRRTVNLDERFFIESVANSLTFFSFFCQIEKCRLSYYHEQAYNIIIK